VTPDRARTLAIVLGVVFVIASLPKFLAYGWELDQFRRFGLPGPDEAWVIAAGVIELVGGALLIAGRAIVPSAVLLAATMVVAFVSSGVLQGDVIPSLTVAPLLLVGCVVLLASARRAPH
jgi:uncharacterized membrane protein YphA (DoxX/SURF4 family)